MSAQAEVAARRKIRRALGVHAEATLATLDTKVALLLLRVGDLEQAFEVLSTRQQQDVTSLRIGITEDLMLLRVRIAGLEADLARRAGLTHSIRARLSWLLTGRLE